MFKKEGLQPQWKEKKTNLILLSWEHIFNYHNISRAVRYFSSEPEKVTDESDKMMMMLLNVDHPPPPKALHVCAKIFLVSPLFFCGCWEIYSSVFVGNRIKIPGIPRRQRRVYSYKFTNLQRKYFENLFNLQSYLSTSTSLMLPFLDNPPGQDLNSFEKSMWSFSFYFFLSFVISNFIFTFPSNRHFFLTCSKISQKLHWEWTCNWIWERINR